MKPNKKKRAYHRKDGTPSRKKNMGNYLIDAQVLGPIIPSAIKPLEA